MPYFKIALWIKAFHGNQTLINAFRLNLVETLPFLNWKYCIKGDVIVNLHLLSRNFTIENLV